MKSTVVSTETAMSLLIVDDNVHFVNRVTKLVQDIPHIGPILIANTFDEANEMLNKEKPDLVLLDISLQGKNGIGILESIVQSGKHCKVIMVTNNTDEYYRQKCIDLGALYFLDKTYDFARIPEIISRLKSA
jgi:response regulator of citrate/malate metabolism